ncbi:Hypothetical predicted protein [Paramuricea clavata]|uniref:Uncharacterized protein n=1 Tax=Paramuricea clavata TaxID=317549 RepID=A0A7D9HU95_PARCT|nr:Hypothetical predicted protein [Paramuricea clavata]
MAGSPSTMTGCAGNMAGCADTMAGYADTMTGCAGRNALTERQRIRIGHYQRQECFEPAAPLPPPPPPERRTEQFVPAAAQPRRPEWRPARWPPLQNAEITSTTRATEARPVEVIVISDDDI